MTSSEAPGCPTPGSSFRVPHVMRILQWPQSAGIKGVLLAALLVNLGAALVAGFLPEWGDEGSFKTWANRSVDQGIHRAYGWGYDWLPLYLYLSKAVGLVFRHSGLHDSLGPYSRILTLLL